MTYCITRYTESRYKVTNLYDKVRHTESWFNAPREYADLFVRHWAGGASETLEEPRSYPALSVRRGLTDFEGSEEAQRTESRFKTTREITAQLARYRGTFESSGEPGRIESRFKTTREIAAQLSEPWHTESRFTNTRKYAAQLTREPAGFESSGHPRCRQPQGSGRNSQQLHTPDLRRDLLRKPRSRVSRLGKQ